MLDNKVTIAICNFNTTKLTNRLIESIFSQKNEFKLNIIVLDNSDKISFTSNNKSIKIINNTKQQFIKFDKIIKQYGGNTINNFANMKHAMSIQFLITICQTKGMILFDSDTYLKKPIDFIDFNFITIGGLQKQYNVINTNITRLPRIVPFIQFFNIDLINKYKLKYFNPLKIIGSNSKISNAFDTGASFYQDIISKKIPYKIINYSDYIYHICGASWAKKDIII